MATTDKGKRSVKTTHTVFDIIETINELETATLSEVAEAVGIAPSTAHDHLTTLTDLHYLDRNGNEYRLGLQFLNYGMRAKEQRGVSIPARPVLEQLAEETGEVAWLFVEEQGRAVYIDRVVGERAVVTDGKVGRHRRLHCIAGGKAMLAEMSDGRVREIIDEEGLTQETGNTITDPEELFEELEAIRERGYAFNEDEAIEGLRAVASGVRIDDLIAAVVVAGPSERLRNDRFREEIPDSVLRAANILELKLKHQ